MADLLVAGDFHCPNAPIPAVAAPLSEYVRASEHALVNLEAPVTAERRRIVKTGPALASHPHSIDHLRRVGFTGVTTANNHILDAGSAGVRDTLRACEQAGLMQTGLRLQSHHHDTSRDLDLQLSNGSVVRVLAYCEHEWSVSKGHVSAQGWSVVRAARDIFRARTAGRRPVVILHGGNEYYPLPRPALREELRFLAEFGAEAIIMHHSHVASAYELWKGVPICYGIGNFQFAMSSPHQEWYEGLLAALTFGESQAELELIPTVMSRAFTVDLAGDDARGRILNRVEGFRIQVESDDAVQALWSEFSGRAGATLLRAAVQPLRSRLGSLASKGLVAYLHRHPERLLVLTNVLRCESLREALISSLEDGVSDAVSWDAVR